MPTCNGFFLWPNHHPSIREIRSIVLMLLCWQTSKQHWKHNRLSEQQCVLSVSSLSVVCVCGFRAWQTAACLPPVSEFPFDSSESPQSTHQAHLRLQYQILCRGIRQIVCVYCVSSSTSSEFRLCPGSSFFPVSCLCEAFVCLSLGLRTVSYS